MHITELEKLSAVEIPKSTSHLFYYSKAGPTKGQAKLNCFHCGSLYEVIVQINTFQQYYPLLVGFGRQYPHGYIEV